MKFIKFIPLFLIAVVTLSCSKDDDTDAYNYNKDNLTGTYSLNSYTAKEVKTEDLNGFNVTTTTTSTGDTFSVTTTFDSNDVMTMDGTYRVLDVKIQGSERIETSYIVVLNNETKSYTVNASISTLKIGDKTYKVSEFSRTGFKMKMEKTSVDPNGDTTVYTEEWFFKK